MNTPRSHRRAVHATATLALLAVLPACAGDPAPDAAAPSGDRLPVVLDYSPTLSDAGALLYLTQSSEVDLLAVTLAGTGEADCEPGVHTTRSLLVLGGRDGVPVGCGRDTPLAGDRDWPEDWRNEANNWGGGILPVVADEPPVDGEALLADTLAGAAEPVTIVATGPLTNLGAVLSARPELADHVGRVVIMGGALDVPGNVEEAPAAEWNFYVDPESVRRVLAAGVPVVVVPLDATDDLPWTQRLLARVGSLDHPVARAVHDMAVSRPSLDGIYLWDELAAMTAVDEGLVTLQAATVEIADTGALVRAAGGTEIQVATAVDADAATDEYVAALNGGVPAAVTPLDDAARSYLLAMGGADSRASALMGEAYTALEEPITDPRAALTEFIDTYFTAVVGLEAEIGALTPPAELTSAHQAYVDSLSQLAGRRDDLLARVAAADGDDPEAVFTQVFADPDVEALVGRLGAACRTLTDFAFVHDGPRPCSATDE